MCTSDGIITNWDNAEKILHHTFYNELRIAPEENAVIIMEKCDNPKANREKTIQVCFETFAVPFFYLGCDAVFSLYANGKTTGVVLQNGATIAHAVPIYEGHKIPHACLKLNLGGANITETVMFLLCNQGYSFRTTAERKIVNDIKEKLCYVCLDKTQEATTVLEKPYELPDGNIITMKDTRYLATEELFNGEYNLQGIVEGSIKKCDNSLSDILYNNINLAGGNTKFEGFKERLQKEIELISTKEFKIFSTLYNDHLPFMGASILSSMSYFLDMCASKDEYEECGPGIVHKKFFLNYFIYN